MNKSMLLNSLLSYTFFVMETILYLLTLFAFLAIGMISAKLIIPGNWNQLVDKLLNLSLYLLLFFMGVRTGLIEDINQKLSMIGGLALVFAVLTTFGSIFVVLLLKRIFHHEPVETPSLHLEEEVDTPKVKEFLAHFRDPLQLFLCVVAGALLSYFTPLFFWFSDSVTNIMLYLLLFFVGVQMVQNNTDVIGVLKDPISILLPLATVIGTLLASSIIPIFTDIKLFEALAIGSGLGWYSLSGVLITELGDPVLGSVAFLSNLFRESIAFLLIPLLASYHRPHAAISIAGATSMDVTLPIIEKSNGTAYVPLSIAHGVILTLIIPFLVPFFYAFG